MPEVLTCEHSSTLTVPYSRGVRHDGQAVVTEGRQ
jgi:hypothetical protein